jgi:transposase-like protein
MRACHGARGRLSGSGSDAAPRAHPSRERKGPGESFVPGPEEHVLAMAHPAYLRDKARSMRIERRYTIDELAERLALSRSTIYYWVRDLPISRKGRPNAGQRLGSRAMKRKYRLLRQAAYEEGRESYDELSSEPGFRDFVCLYIAEGYKRNRNVVSICNSDDAVLRLALRWINRLGGRPPRFSIQYHADQDLNELRGFWNDALGIGLDAIRFQRKSNSGQLTGRTWRSRHGVLNVMVSDSYFRARLQAWIDLVRAEWIQGSD